MRYYIPVIMGLILLWFSTCSEEPVEGALPMFLFENAVIASENLPEYEKASNKLVAYYTDTKYPYPHLVFHLSDTLFFSLTGINSYADLQPPSASSNISHTRHLESHKSTTRYVHRGILHDVSSLGNFKFSDIKGGLSYTMWETCYIHPGTALQFEQSLMRWRALHDSLQTGLQWETLMGTFGFKAPPYINIIVATDSASLQVSFQTLFEQAGAQVRAMQSEERPYYRNRVVKSRQYRPDLSYWPHEFKDS